MFDMFDLCKVLEAPEAGLMIQESGIRIIEHAGAMDNCVAHPQHARNGGGVCCSASIA